MGLVKKTLLIILLIGLYQNTFAQGEISTESKIYPSLGIDALKLQLDIWDAEIAEKINAQIIILDEENTKINLTKQYAVQGYFEFDLPFLKKYTLHLSHERFIDTTFVLDLTKIEGYTQQKKILLRPKKVNLDISIRDIDTDEPVLLGGNLNNKNRNEQINLHPKDNRFGKYKVNVREQDEYELEVKNPNGFVYYTQNSIIPQKSKDNQLDVKVVQVLKVKTKIPLHNITFAYKSADLNEISRKELDRIVMLLQDYPNALIEIGAHTDSKGLDKANLKLSIQRAESVLNYMTSKGISSKNLKVKGYGASNPIANNQTEEGRAKNRRFELLVLKL